MKPPLNFRLASMRSSVLVLAAFVAAGRLQAAEKGSEQVSSFAGTLGYTVPIEVPAFHGIEPRIALAYNSEGRNGTVGVGWSITGFSTVERVNAGRGAPRFDAGDVYLLNGQELVACTPSTVSPSCATGGTHATKIESYVKIRFDAGANAWTVWGRDGTRTILQPIATTTLGTPRWGEAQRIDTLGNQVDSAWACLDGECYPSTNSYNGYGVTVYRELRPDVLSSGAVTSIAQTRYRVRSILVHLGSTPIRAYKLSYTQSPLTGRSLLVSVQQYGKDVAIDGQGAISGGSSLPPVTFAYQDDAIGKGFHSMAVDPTPPGTVQPVTWTNLNNASATGASGNSLYKTIDTFAWDAGASSREAIVSGDGYVEWTGRFSDGYQMAGLSNGDSNASYDDLDFALAEWHEDNVLVFESGVHIATFPFANGDKLRVEVQGGEVRYKRNGVTLYTSAKAPVYPLRVDTSIANYSSTIHEVFISGALQDVAHWCNVLPTTADFNGDGRTDQSCYTGSAQGVRVSLATPTGFLPPTNWLPNTSLNPGTLGDFNGDGKLDIVDFSSWEGWFRVALSTGTAFSAPVFWGDASGWAADGYAYACRNVGEAPTNIGTGDFNGDGRTDVWCKVYGREEIFIGLSTGSAFSFSIWAQFPSDYYERVGSLDFDGDGKDDWYFIHGGSLIVNRSTGSSFVYHDAGLSLCDMSYVLGDFNGDGKTDAYCRVNGDIALSTGRSFVGSGSLGAWCGASTDVFPADVDGDGASELVCNNGPVLVRKWTGSGFGPEETWKDAWCPVGALGAGDFNGDTKTDLFCRTLGAPVAYAGTGGLKADLLSGVTTSLGGTLQAGYTLSTASSANGPPPKYVVASLTVGDGRGGTATRTFSYSGAYLNHLERRFIGFRRSRSHCPATPAARRWRLGSARTSPRRAGPSGWSGAVAPGSCARPWPTTMP